MSTVAGCPRDAEDLAARHVHVVEPIVRQLAAGYPPHVDRDDLRGAGAFGLVHAAHRFESSDGVPFATYARHRIRGAILDEVRRRDWAPRSVRRRLREMTAATTALEHRLARHPTSHEIAAELHIEVELVDSAYAQHTKATFLSAELPATADDDAPIVEQLRDNDPAVLPADAAEHREMLEILGSAIAALPRRLRRIIIEHDLSGHRLGQIAEELGISDARASQLRHEAILALRAAVGEMYEDVPVVCDGAPGKAVRAAVVEEVRDRHPSHGAEVSPVADHDA